MRPVGLQPSSEGLAVVGLVAVESVFQVRIKEQRATRGTEDGCLVCLLEVNEDAGLAALLGEVMEGTGELRNGEECGLAQAVLQRG